MEANKRNTHRTRNRISESVGRDSSGRNNSSSIRRRVTGSLPGDSVSKAEPIPGPTIDRPYPKEGNNLGAAELEKKHGRPTDEEIKAQAELVGHLYPRYQTRRLEFGLQLIHLRDMTAHRGNGKFTQIVTQDLGIPRSTVYDAIDFADAELKRIRRESLSENRTNSEASDDTVTEFDWDDPKDVERILKLAYPQGIPKRERVTKPYIKGTQLHLILNRPTRLKVAAAWTVLKQHKQLHKALCNKIAKEVIDAAGKISKKTDD